MSKKNARKCEIGIRQAMNQLGISTMIFYCYNFCSEADTMRIVQFERYLIEEAREACRVCFSQKKNQRHRNVPFEDLLYA